MCLIIYKYLLKTYIEGYKADKIKSHLKKEKSWYLFLCTPCGGSFQDTKFVI